MIITSRENKIFKTAMLLKTARGRSENGMFIVEGIRSVRDAISKNARLFCVIEKDGVKTDIEYTCPVYTFAPKLFDNIAETVTPQGVMAIIFAQKHSLEDIAMRGRDCVIMCEALQDPGNIGTVIRTAHASSLGGVVLTKGCCDLYNPKIVRSTMTGMMSLPVVQNVTATETVKFFREKGYRVIAGALTDYATDLYETSMEGKCLIVIGNEGNGVTEETLSMCDNVVKIPMENDAESLNAAIAGAVMMYEHYRQNLKK